MKARKFRPFLIVPLLLLGSLLVACGGADPRPTPTTEPTSTTGPSQTATPERPSEPPDDDASVGGGVGNRAPEFQGIESWIGSEPLTMAGLRGKVVLVDFWTYTCVNCIRTFPYLRAWHDKYAEHGLVIVGVHTPEFEFEKLRENVVRAIAEHNLAYPVAQDNEFGTWRAYENRAWPAKYLIDAEGFVRYSHLGEGAYDQTERRVRDLLLQNGADLSDVEPDYSPSPAFDPGAFSAEPETSLTRELYGGSLRNYSQQGLYVGHLEYYEQSGVLREYTDPGEHFNHVFYLQGPWFNGPESVIHGRRTEGFEDYIALKFFATSVNAVIDPQVLETFEVEVTLDGRALSSEEAGADVVVRDGRSYFVVDQPRMYGVVALPTLGGHHLKLSAKSEGFALFAFTFGAYEQGP